MSHSFHEYGSASLFEKIWRACFSHVKIREFKAVCGKCKTCDILCCARKTFHDAKSREHITNLHAYHRTMYMGERQCYYERRNEAMQRPTTVWSLISDGMAQIHCQLPYQAGLSDFPVKLPQHIQGVLVHGKLMDVHRTFHNVVNNANASIHSFLLTLEKLYKQNENRFASKLYYQVDGGSENTAKVMFGIAELLVAKGHLKEMFITRLPVGHTHEDIDAKFAKIWKRVRCDHIATVDQYATCIKQALQPSESDSLPCEVVDTFVVPDYTSYIIPFLDNKFARYAKDKWTQLQWRFQSVDKSEDFPLGVKTTYRAYCRNEVLLVNPDDSKEFGFNVQNARVNWFPAATDNQPEGLYLLQSIPTGVILPEPFIDGSRKVIDDVVKKVISTFLPKENIHAVNTDESKNNKNYCHKVVTQWMHFSDNIAPQSDCVNEYCTLKPLRIPLFKELFSDIENNTTLPSARPIETNLAVTNVTFQDSVQWSRRGVKRALHHPANKGPLAEVARGSGRDSSDGSDLSTDGNLSDEDDFNYRELTTREKLKYSNIIQKYRGKTFKDMGDDNNSYEGIVQNIVYESNSKTLCFSFQNTSPNKTKATENLQYIVTDFAMHDCEWIDLEEIESDSSSQMDCMDKSPRWVGYQILEENETRKPGLYDKGAGNSGIDSNPNKRVLRSQYTSK